MAEAMTSLIVSQVPPNHPAYQDINELVAQQVPSFFSLCGIIMV
jgi:maltose-binding protein MalE